VIAFALFFALAACGLAAWNVILPPRDYRAEDFELPNLRTKEDRP